MIVKRWNQLGETAPTTIEPSLDVRAAFIAAAGLDAEIAGAKLRAAVATFEHLLSAKTVTRIVYRGDVVETFLDEDVSTQLRAADLLASTVTKLYGGERDEQNVSKSLTLVAAWFDAPPESSEKSVSERPVSNRSERLEKSVTDFSERIDDSGDVCV